MRFINQTRSLKLLLAMLVMILQSCANAPDTSVASSRDEGSLANLGNDIVGMLEVTSAKGYDANHFALSSSQHNRYLEQAEIRLADVPKSTLSQYQAAIDLMRRQEWQAADTLFDEVIASQPKLSGAYVNKALIALQHNDMAAANTQLDEALLINADNPYAHQIKANLFRTQGQYEQAEQHYRTALAIWPQYPEAQANLGILLELYRGKYLEARQYYLAYLANQPSSEQGKRWLAGVEIKIQRAGLSIPTDISESAAQGTQQERGDGQ